MRLCFNGFCLGPQRPLAVDQSAQTILTLSTAIDTLNITTFFNKSSSSSDAHQTHYNNSHEIINPKPGFFDKFKMINQEDSSFHIINSDFNNSANNSTMFSHTSDNNSINTIPSQFIVDAADSQNNNLLHSSSQIELVKHDDVDTLNNTVGNIYINDCADINMQDIESEQQLTEKEKDLIKVIQLKDLRINELNQMVLHKNDEIANLKSHLDKFQSVFSGFRSVPGAMGRKMGRNIQQRQRVGISAEPQSESSMHDLLSVTFPKYEKEEQ